ncbi:MAG: phosphohistidine phosphatase SixA [Gammaproteobacteria bacterium CG22_combo_CG10-13_8_21_14_all_40_8]|nr:MAG: phosphohistidine phosphatase SixA [Gammaproteobacteria bacterium CG22_combo_CG10-13_8_21_14_all_40_8]
MKVFILRHGDSEPMQIGHTDKHRKLTLHGVEQVERIAHWMQQHHHRPDLIISSPYKRTRQTAEIIHRLLEIERPIEYEDCLISGCDPKESQKLIDALEIDSVLLVSHMPLVGELTSLLAPALLSKGFSTATIAKINYSQELAHGTVMAHLSPSEV